MERCKVCNESRGIGELNPLVVGEGQDAETWHVCPKCLLLINIHQDLDTLKNLVQSTIMNAAGAKAPEGEAS